MENIEHMGFAKLDSPEVLPSLIKSITANEVAGFDSVKKHNILDNQSQPTAIYTFFPSAAGTKTDTVQSQNGLSQSQRTQSVPISMPPFPMEVHLQSTKRVLCRNDGETQSVPISMPPSPMEVHLQSTKRVLCRNDVETNFKFDGANSSTTSKNASAKQEIFHSLPMPTGSTGDEAIANRKFSNRPELPGKNPRFDKLKDERYNSFKTWSGKLEKQLSHLHGKQRLTDSKENIPQNVEVKSLHVDRYFDALEGPELDTLRDSEEILLPEDKQWPFLLRYPISSFGICLGISSQAIMWKILATSASTKFLHVSLYVNLILWCISVALMAVVSFVYSLKLIFYFEAVRREYYHPIRVNFFFAPWIALLFLALGVPPCVTQKLHAALWYILMTPIFCLEVKIYGQWMSGGQRRLSKVANPSNHLAVVGNFVGALLGASMELKEGPIFFFAVGLAHYTVLFVTLYQRLPTNETLPKELHPVFFLFVAAPSVASMAWERIQGSFDYGSRIAYFIALFLYVSLAVRINFFRGFRFSLSWWAYTFPMTGASIATIKYSNEVTNLVTQSLSVILSSISTLTVTALLVTTVFHAFVLGDLFPNDIAIAISVRRPKTTQKWYHRRSGRSDNKDTENYLKFSNPGGKDVEACMTSPSSTTKETRPESQKN